MRGTLQGRREEGPVKIGLSMCQRACWASPPQLHDQALIVLPEGGRILIERYSHRLKVETINLLAANPRTWTALEDVERYASGSYRSICPTVQPG